MHDKMEHKQQDPPFYNSHNSRDKFLFVTDSMTKKERWPGIVLYRPTLWTLMTFITASMNAICLTTASVGRNATSLAYWLLICMDQWCEGTASDVHGRNSVESKLK